MQVSVRAYPAQGHEYRRRAGRAWGTTPTIVTVTEDPKGPADITAAQLDALKGDPMIAVIPVGAATEGDLDVAAMRGELAKRTAELDAARKALSEAVEQIDIERRRATAAEEAVAEKVARLTAEVDHLRSKASKK